MSGGFFPWGGWVPAGGGGGPVTVSDDFSADTIANWVDDGDAGTWAIGGGSLSCSWASGEHVTSMLRYGTAVGTGAQYAKIKLVASSGSYAIGLVVRAAASGYRYLLSGPYHGTVYWSRSLPDGSGNQDIASGTLDAVETGQSMGVTVTGTGTSTVTRVWRNPTAAAPTSVSSWDGASDPPDLTLTDTGSLLASNAADSGQYVGVFAYSEPSGTNVISLDDFSGGGL